MMSVLKSLLASKKFTVALAATLVWAAGLLGLDVSAETIGTILSPLYVYVLGQGIADAGGARTLNTGASK